MTTDERDPSKIGCSLTAEDAAELIAAFFHSRNRVGALVLRIEARRKDTYSVVERLDFDESIPLSRSL